MYSVDGSAESWAASTSADEHPAALQSFANWVGRSATSESDPQQRLVRHPELKLKIPA